jgi:hypothetical protein
MATTTITHAVDPTETPYALGSVPLTETGVLVVQIYGYGCLAGLIILMLSTFIYCTFIKPHKLRAAKTAAAMDIEVCPLVLSSTSVLTICTLESEKSLWRSS